MVRITEERYRASLRDKRCIACDRRMPWWAALGLTRWVDCGRCGARHCHEHRLSERTQGGCLSEEAERWRCCYRNPVTVMELPSGGGGQLATHATTDRVEERRLGRPALSAHTMA